MIKEIKRNNISIKVSEIGAELKSLYDHETNTEYIWCSDKTYWNRSAPILFPIVGSLRDKETIINGTTYKLKQHGFLRDTAFKITRFSTHKDSWKIIYTLEENEDTLKVYPFKFQVQVIYKIRDDALETIIKVYNKGDDVLPFNLGGHPAINCPLFEGEKFTDYKITFNKEETFESPKVCEDATLDFNNPVLKFTDLKVLELNKEMFDVDTIIIPKVESSFVYLTNQEDVGVKFSFSNFKTLAIWTPANDAPFICLEPWMGYNDLVDTDKNFLKKDDLVLLKKGQTFTASYRIDLVKDKPYKRKIH